jgi:acyl-CoA synthetase (NDP forming)
VTQELARIFHPRSIAVIGASSNPDKLGYLLIKGFVDLDFTGHLYPINPNTRQRILDLDVYASVKEINADIDLAVITLPPQAAIPIVKECVEKEAKGIVLFSAFPDEVGPEELEIKETLSLARKKGVRIIGPNSMGLYSPSAGLAIFADLPKQSGPVGFISHSGALAFTFSKYLGNRGIGFSKVVACGNEWDLTWTDFLEYLGQDRETGIIAGYVEGTKDGTRLMRVASEITHRKPVIVVKGGKSSAGSQFISSHTGSIAGNHDIWSSVFEQSGVICVESFEELIEHVIVFNYFMHHPVGDRIAIISGTGGPITMAADLCEKLGLQIPSLSTEVRAKLQELIPPTGTSSRNPVDVSIAAATNVNLYTKPIELLDKSDEIDMMLCIHTGDWRGEEVAQAIAGIAHNIRKPLVVVLVGTPEKSSQSITTLLKAGIPAFTSAEGALKALASLVTWKRKSQQQLP